MKHKMKVTLNNMESTDNKKTSSLFISAYLNSKRPLSKLYIMLSFCCFGSSFLNPSVALGLNRKVDEYLKFHWRVFLSKLQVAPLPAELKFMYMPDTHRVFFFGMSYQLHPNGPRLERWNTRAQKPHTKKKNWKEKRTESRKRKGRTEVTSVICVESNVSGGGARGGGGWRF